MKLKFTLAAIAATATLSGTVLLGAGQAQACMFSKQGGITDSAPSSNPAPTTTGVDSGNFNKLGMVGAGVALLGGLLGGGLLLKQRFDRQSQPSIGEEVPAEALPELTEPIAASTPFAIEVPREVIESLNASTADESELASVK